ncbi:MAG: hypothetical protein IPM50_07300 [Acidobacteriota bacterium]|nr:MAG: hypothetical protein IPM50_07300 [Acidobacteriota bacterium]
MNKPTMKANGLSRLRIEKFASTTLKDFCPEALDRLLALDIERFYETYLPKRFGISTGYQRLAHGIHGYTNPSRLESAVSTELIEAHDRSTLRFGRSTIGHEAGHCVLHAHQFKKKNEIENFTHDGTHAPEQRLFRRDEIKAFECPEWQAWEFCKSLFLPKQVIEAEVERGATVRSISEIVNLNPAFVEVRLRNLRLLDKVRAF